MFTGNGSWHERSPRDTRVFSEKERKLSHALMSAVFPPMIGGTTGGKDDIHRNNDDY